jgi:hypothetical protein
VGDVTSQKILNINLHNIFKRYSNLSIQGDKRISLQIKSQNNPFFFFLNNIFESKKYNSFNHFSEIGQSLVFVVL